MLVMLVLLYPFCFVGFFLNYNFEYFFVFLRFKTISVFKGNFTLFALSSKITSTVRLNAPRTDLLRKKCAVYLHHIVQIMGNSRHQVKGFETYYCGFCCRFSGNLQQYNLLRFLSFPIEVGEENPQHELTRCRFKNLHCRLFSAWKISKACKWDLLRRLYFPADFLCTNQQQIHAVYIYPKRGCPT